MSIAARPRSRVAVRQRQDFLKNHRGAAAAAAGFLKFIAAAAAAGFLKFIAAAVDFLKIHRGSGSIFFEDIEKVHEFDRILVFTSETS
jgi:predicted butyrate kinase (DUF1464 family)